MKTRKDMRKELEGYQSIKQEIEICQKYGRDYRNERGMKAAVIDRLHPRSLQLIVSEIIIENVNTKTFRLVPVGRTLPPFLAGQYLTLMVEIDGIRTSRAYSISSSPTQTAYYDLTIGRVENGFVSNYLLNEIKVGDTLMAGGPMGNFYYNPLFHSQKLVFLAGGTGITPFMSMIRMFTDQNANLQIYLLYGCRSLNDAQFLTDLNSRAALHPNFKYEMILSEPNANYHGRTGFIDANLIQELIGSPTDATFYLCGPSAMQKFCTEQLQSLGVTQRNIRREAFIAPADAFADPGWPKDIRPEKPVILKVESQQGEVLTIESRAGEPVLTALERAGLAIPNGCRTGECSLCRVRMTSGQVFQPSGALIRHSDRTFGFIHSCRAYPLTDLTLVI